MRSLSFRTISVVSVFSLLFAGCGDSEDGPAEPSDGKTGGGGAGAEGGAGGAGALGGGGMGAGGSGGMGGGYEVVDCGVTLSSPEGTCSVDGAGPGKLLVAGAVLAPDTLYRGGQVLVDDSGVITCVGCDCAETPLGQTAGRITCADGVVSPGLINPHDHITFANNAPADHGLERYGHRHDWRVGKDEHTEINVNSGAPANVVRFAELRFIMSGTTSGATAGGQAGLMRNLDSGSLMGGLTFSAADSDTFPLDDANGWTNTSGCDYGNDPTTAADIADENAYLPHVAEGIENTAQNEFVCISTGQTDVLEAQSSLIHAIGITAQDSASIRAEGASIVWSPRSNIDLYGNTAAVTLLDAVGVPIALGTDWVPSGSINYLRELACADYLNQNYFGSYFSDVALWRMVTINGAIATGTDQAIGMLKPGYVADIAIFDGSTNTDHRAVIAAGVEDVVLVMRGGSVLYGDDAVVAAPLVGGQTCETLDVCGRAKRACVSQDLGGAATLAQIRTAGEAFYPLHSCGGAPPSEPSCVPYRTEYPDGITAADTDGDGVPDAADSCPGVFNPARPMDNGNQADFDNDGMGDVCDICPLDGSDACAPVSANDIDGDGISNGSDNCLEISNADQLDSDEDGKGDGCDLCPTEPNPGGSPCPAMAYTIPELRNPADPNYPGVGAMVSITNAYVTAVRPDTGGSRGFYIQDTSLSPYSGVFVFTQAMPPGVQVGNRVTINGELDEFFDLTEIINPFITVDDAGTTLPFGPVAVLPTDIANGGSMSETHESMLVSVGAVAITVMNSDDPQDFDEFTVTGNLRIDDEIFAALDNTCPVGTAFTGLTGPLTYTFSNHKLAPRSAADVGVVGCQPFP